MEDRDNIKNPFLPQKNEAVLLVQNDFRFRHFPEELLQLIIKCIVSADESRLERLREALAEDEFIAACGLNEGDLKQAKYKSIAAVAAVGSRVAGGGLIYEHAAAMIDLFIYRADKAKDAHELYGRLYDAFVGFALLAAQGSAPGRKLSAPILKAQNYISRSLYRELRLADIAAQCSLSASYFSALFKKETGMTVSEYIMREKLREAEYMLITGEYKISDICYFLNFCSQSYFTHYFKKYYGVTPAQYRRNAVGLHNG